jgi:hypothetical protein
MAHLAHYNPNRIGRGKLFDYPLSTRIVLMWFQQLVLGLLVYSELLK